MSAAELPPPGPNLDSADEVFRRWEQLRIVYNLVLGLAMIPFLKQFLDQPQFTMQVLEGAVGANLCFCAGPVVEGYAAMIGLPRRPTRWVIFAGGLLLSLALEIAFVAVQLIPNQP